MKKIKWSIFGILILVSCYLLTSWEYEVKTSVDQLEWFISGNKFELVQIYYGGLAGRSSTSYHFKPVKDSVQVKLDPEYYSKNEIMISQEEFTEIKAALKCIALNHSDNTIPATGCIGPFFEEFYIQKGFKKMRLFNPKIETCRFNKILFTPKNFPKAYELD